MIQPLVSGRLFRPAFGEVPYAIVIRLRRAVIPRDIVNRLAVQRHGNVATHAKLLASRRLGRSAEGKTDRRCSEAGAKDRDLPPPDIRLIVSSNAVVRAGFSIGEACQAGERSQQLQRWLCNKLPRRQRTLGWM